MLPLKPLLKMNTKNSVGIKTSKSVDLIKRIKKNKFLILLFLPGLLYFIIFDYIPMGGIVLAFKDYNVFKGIFNSPWVGFRYFEAFFSDPNFFRLLRNTVLLSVYNLIFSFPAPLILALLLNELKWSPFKKVVQTVTYVPHFISTAIIVGIMVTFLSPSTGIINTLLHSIFNIEPIYFFGDPAYFRTLYIASGIWAHIGFGSIIYLAAIAGVDPQLYEACKIDGGDRWKQLIHITIPGIIPTIVILLILNIGGLMSVGSEKVLLMYNPLTYETADVYSTYVYRIGLMGANFSIGTAIGLFNNIVGLILIILANRIARRVSEHSLW